MGFYKVLEEYQRNKELDPIDIHIMSIVKGFEDNNQECYISNQGISNMIHCHKDTVSKHIRSLIKKGYLTEQIKENNKRILKTGSTYPIGESPSPIGKSPSPYRQNTYTPSVNRLAPIDESPIYNTNNKNNNKNINKGSESVTEEEKEKFMKLMDSLN